MTNRKANIVREFEFEGVTKINGVTFDGQRVWFADGTRGGLVAIEPREGKVVARLAHVPAGAGTAFDGRHIYQIEKSNLHEIDPDTGEILRTMTIPGTDDNSGMAWAEGALWIGRYKTQRIVKVDIRSWKIVKEIASDRMVTGVTWVDGELWHATGSRTSTGEQGTAELRRVDPETGAVRDTLELPEGVSLSGLEADGQGRFWCGDPQSGKLRLVERAP